MEPTRLQRFGQSEETNNTQQKGQLSHVTAAAMADWLASQFTIVPSVYVRTCVYEMELEIQQAQLLLLLSCFAYVLRVV